MTGWTPRRDRLIDECESFRHPRRDALIDECQRVADELRSAERCRLREQRYNEAKPSRYAWSMMAVAEFLRVTNGNASRGAVHVPSEAEPTDLQELHGYDHARLVPEDVRLMRRAREDGRSVSALARDYGVARSTAYNAVRFATHKAVPRAWWSPNDPRPEVELFAPGVLRAAHEVDSSGPYRWDPFWS